MFPLIIKTAQSTVLSISNDFSIRLEPSSPVSSIPAVSIMMAGPIPNISMDFFTGS